MQLRDALFLTAVALSFTLPLSESIKNISFGVLSLLWLALVLRRQSRWPSLLTPLAGAHLVLVAVAFVSAATAYDPWQGLRGAWDMARAFLFFLILATAGFRSRQIYWILVALVAGVVVGSFWGFYDLWSGAKYSFQIHSLGHQNHTATYLILAQCIIVGFLLGPRLSRRASTLWVLSEVILLVGLVFTHSRTAALTTGLVLVALAFRARCGLPVLFCGLLAALIYKGSTLKSRIRWTKPFTRLRYGYERLLSDPIRLVVTSSGRIGLWKESMRAVRESPWFGFGPRNYKFLTGMGYSTHTDHAHSLYINVAVEMGLVGLGALILYLATYIWTWRQFTRCALDGLQSVLATAVLGSWLTIAVAGLVTTTFHTEGAMLFTGLMGLFFATFEANEGLAAQFKPDYARQPVGEEGE